ncbi:MAG: RNA-binding protein [Tissierellia bacterium]|jgi:RNA-binding protein YlmH|nr:RNA-binding protein [Tissierellia bacterium]
MYIDKEKYIAHIVDNDKIILMRQLLDKIENVSLEHSIENTDFLDPYEIYLSKSILNRFHIGYYEDGGITDAERKIIQIFPDYYESSSILSPIKALKVRGHISGLSHKDFLGALLNVGIKRSKVGDILLYEDYSALIVKSEISDFILLNLEKIGNKNISLQEMDLENLTTPNLKYKDMDEFIASTRLDIVISSAYNLSRIESSKLIKSGRVKVNWKEINKPSIELEKGDVISIRGYGRAILYSLEGLSKKGRLKATIRILI